jgi:inner membrane transporter RhtA
MGEARNDVAAGSPILPVLALLVSMASFTSGASFAKRLFPAVGPEGATTLRLVGGALMLMILMRPWRTLSRATPLQPVILYGLAMGFMNLLFYLALARIPLGIAVALEFTGPLAVTIASSRARADLLWLALACAGLLLLLPLAGGIHGIDPVGAVMALGAGICWALYIVAGKKAGATHGVGAAALGMSIGALAIVPIGIAHAGMTLLRPDILLAGVVVAFLSSALPYSLEMVALRHLKVQTYGTLTSCEPAVGSLAGLVLLHEALSPMQVVAIALIVVAAAGATATAARSGRKEAVAAAV